MGCYLTLSSSVSSCVAGIEASQRAAESLASWRGRLLPEPLRGGGGSEGHLYWAAIGKLWGHQHHGILVSKTEKQAFVVFNRKPGGHTAKQTFVILKEHLSRVYSSEH